MSWLRRLFTGSALSERAQDACLRKGYQLAYDLLRMEGTFPPIAIGVDETGAQKVCVSEDGDPESVRRWLQEGVAKRSFVEVYLFCMVELRGDPPAPCSETPTQAVGVYIDRPSNSSTCEVVFTPYEVHDGDLRLGRPKVTETNDRVLT